MGLWYCCTLSRLISDVLQRASTFDAWFETARKFVLPGSEHGVRLISIKMHVRIKEIKLLRASDFLIVWAGNRSRTTLNFCVESCFRRNTVNLFASKKVLNSCKSSSRPHSFTNIFYRFIRVESSPQSMFHCWSIILWFWSLSRCQEWKLHLNVILG